MKNESEPKWLKLKNVNLIESYTKAIQYTPKWFNSIQLPFLEILKSEKLVKRMKQTILHFNLPSKVRCIKALKTGIYI